MNSERDAWLCKEVNLREDIELNEEYFARQFLYDIGKIRSLREREYKLIEGKFVIENHNRQEINKNYLALIC